MPGNPPQPSTVAAGTRQPFRPAGRRRRGPPNDGPEDVPICDSRRRCPGVDRHFHPRWHRFRSDAAVLADKIDNAPPSIALLKVRKVRAATFNRRSPQPRRTARMARSRNPRIVEYPAHSAAPAPAVATTSCPREMPVDFTPFTRLIPWANSGASRPLSAASAASLRIADIFNNDGRRTEPPLFERYCIY
jgi:hypothetical protein